MESIAESTPEAQAAAVLERALTLAQRYPLTRETYARRRDLVEVAFADDDAYCFCTIGFILRATYDLGLWSPADAALPAAYDLALMRVICALPEPANLTGCVVRWNDRPERTIEDLRDVFARAHQRALTEAGY